MPAISAVGHKGYVFGILAVNPCHPMVHLLSVGIDSITRHPGNRTSVSILYLGLNLSLVPKAQFRELLLRPGTERLPSLRRVDFRERIFTCCLFSLRTVRVSPSLIPITVARKMADNILIEFSPSQSTERCTA